MLRLSGTFLVGLLLAVLIGAPLASGDTNTVTVDPNSPAGTEYQIPIAKARSEGQDTSKHKSGGNSGLFGAGIKSQTATTPTTTTPAPAPKKKHKHHRKHRSTAAVPAPTSPPPSSGKLVSDASKSPGSGSGTLAAFIVGALVMLALAAFGGRHLRRRSERPSGGGAPGQA